MSGKWFSRYGSETGSATNSELPWTHRKSCGARPSGVQRPQLSLSVLSYQNPLTKTDQRNLDRKSSCWVNKNRKPQNVLNCRVEGVRSSGYAGDKTNCRPPTIATTV